MIHEHAPVKESYEHMKGTEKRAHEGSQSMPPHPTSGANAVYGTKTMHGGGTSVDPRDTDKGNPKGMQDVDE